MGALRETSVWNANFSEHLSFATLAAKSRYQIAKEAAPISDRKCD